MFFVTTLINALKMVIFFYLHNTRKWCMMNFFVVYTTVNLLGGWQHSEERIRETWEEFDLSYSVLWPNQISHCQFFFHVCVNIVFREPCLIIIRDRDILVFWILLNTTTTSNMCSSPDGDQWVLAVTVNHSNTSTITNYQLDWRWVRRPFFSIHQITEGDRFPALLLHPVLLTE